MVGNAFGVTQCPARIAARLALGAIADARCGCASVGCSGCIRDTGQSAARALLSCSADGCATRRSLARRDLGPAQTRVPARALPRWISLTTMPSRSRRCVRSSHVFALSTAARIVGRTRIGPWRGARNVSDRFARGVNGPNRDSIARSAQRASMRDAAHPGARRSKPFGECETLNALTAANQLHDDAVRAPGADAGRSSPWRDRRHRARRAARSPATAARPARAAGDTRRRSVAAPDRAAAHTRCSTRCTMSRL